MVSPGLSLARRKRDIGAAPVWCGPYVRLIELGNERVTSNGSDLGSGHLSEYVIMEP
jgi:hypothetical protein